MIRILLALILTLGTVGTAAAQELKLVERATTDATHHVGPKDDNLADILTFANEVYDSADKTKKGTDQGYCIRVLVAKAFECTWTLTLPEGQIMVEGPFFDDADSVLAITGGTGRYAGARGEMKLHARDAKGSEYDFTYVLHHTSPP